MLEVFEWALFALFVVAILLAIVVVTIRRGSSSKTPSQPGPKESRGPLTRPNAPSDLGTLRTSREDHTHMQSGTIREDVPHIRTTLFRTNLEARLQNHLQRTLDRVLPFRTPLGSRPWNPQGLGSSTDDVVRYMSDLPFSYQDFEVQNSATPGVQGTITRTVPEVQESQRLEQEVRDAPEEGKKPESSTPKVKRKNRYHRDPVI